MGRVEPRLWRQDVAMMDFPRRGHIHWVSISSEPGTKKRPALVVSINARNRFARDVMVIPASTVLRPAPTHVRLRAGQGGLPKDSVLKCEQLTTLPKEALSDSPLGGPLAPTTMVNVEKAILRAIGVPVEA